jgi:transposase
MLAYKCTASGRRFVEVPSKFSTKTCAACGSLSGPTGYTGLSVRQWVCAVCGTAHDRDINAAVNTLVAGVGTTPEGHRKVALESPGFSHGEVQNPEDHQAVPAMSIQEIIQELGAVWTQ